MAKRAQRLSLLQQTDLAAPVQRNADHLQPLTEARENPDQTEERHGFQLFTRSNKRVVQLTDAGRVFIREARSALKHIKLAVSRARAAHRK